MTDLIIIRGVEYDPSAQGPDERVRLPASRATLAKRRWRGVAEDGKEFGFDLEEALTNGEQFFFDGTTGYVLEQTPEEVLEIPVATLEQAARVAWSLGNLHFGVQILPDAVRVAEDPAVRQFLAREGIAFERVNRVFLPLSASPQHAHPHSHHG
jgi:urease accessory protein